MAEHRLDNTSDPVVQHITTGNPLDAAAKRGNVQKKKGGFSISVDISDKNSNYYDGMDQYAGLKKKHRPICKDYNL